MTYFKKLFEDVPVKFNIANILFIFVWTFLDCAFVTLLSNLISGAASGNNSLLAPAITFILFVLAWELLEYVADVFSCMSASHIENNAFKNAFYLLYTTSPETLKKSNSGYIAGLLNKMVFRKEKAYMAISEYLLMGILYNLYVIYYLSRFSLWFGFAVFLMTTIAIGVRIVAIKVTRPKVDVLHDAESTRNKIFMDSATNISTVQKLRSKKFLGNKIEVINDSCLKAAKRWVMLDDFFFCLYKFIMYMVCPICLIVMFLIKDTITFDQVEFLAFLSITEVKLVHYSKNIAVAIRDYGLWKASQMKLDSITKYQSPMYTKTSVGGDFNKIEMHNVVYSYTTDDKNSVTVKIPHFEVCKGDFVSICGESGQGKTTTLNLLSGAIENNSILIDRKPLDKNIGAVYIAQDVEMFDMSLRDNLSLGANVDDATLIDLLHKVGLAEWFEKQEKGLDVILGERGVFISTGQRQRLNLLRGLLIKDKEIYLLDEPTSNVDDYTEKQMISLIKERLAGKTVIIVTHKEGIKEICNKHYKFVNGEMQEG